MTRSPKLSRRLANFVIAAWLLPLNCAAADDSAKIRTLVDAAIRPLIAAHDVPGMAVAVTVNGRANFFNYGLASRAANTPVGETTLFELGSISNTFTATLASYAQVLGKLSLDDHPSQHMTDLKGSAIDKASLLHLGSYTAGGLPLQFPDEVSNERMLDYFRHWTPAAPAGSRRDYSNPSLGLFGHITALALKTEFTDAMQTQLFPQLGLRRSYIRVPDDQMGSYAWGYTQANKPIRVSPGVLAAQSYGVKSSATDMIHYVQASIDPSRLAGPMRRAVEGTQIGYFKVGAMVQGLGWEQYPYPVTLERLLAGNSVAMSQESNPATRIDPPLVPTEPTLFNKTGATAGFSSYAAFVPAQKMGIVMLANKFVPSAARITAAHAILAQLAQLEPMLAAHSTPPRP